MDAERLTALAELLPILEDPQADFGHWDPARRVDGVLHLPAFTFGPTAEAFRAAVGRGGWIVTGFDWMTWLRTEDGQALHDRPDAVATASVDDLAKLITAIVRSDRFVEGSLVGAFESGLLVAIARRAAALLGDGAR